MTESRYTTQEEIDDMRHEIARAMEKKKAGKRRSKRLQARILSCTAFILNVDILLSVLTSILIAKKKGQTPSVMGFHLFRVETASMAPTLTVGSVILSRKPRDASDLKEGDIVTFSSPSGTLVTHRIFRVLEGEEGEIRYMTKGDNPINDPDSDLLPPVGVIAVFIAKIPLT